jgi:WD40 repeat protein
MYIFLTCHRWSRIVTDGHTLASGSAEHTVRLWDIITGKCLAICCGHSNWVTSVAFSPCGKFLASGSADHTIKLWDVTTGECLYTYHEHTHVVSSVIFSPQGKTLASGSQDQTIKLWDIKTGKCLKTLRTPRLYEGMNITYSRKEAPAYSKRSGERNCGVKAKHPLTDTERK